MKKTVNVRSWMEKYAPLGINLAAEVVYYVITMTVGTFWSFNFFLRYMEDRNSLFEWWDGEQVIMEGAMVRTFEELTENVFVIFGIILIYTIIITVYHYLYHYQGSKMMYLMKRLPDKWEVHKRCLVLPAAAFFITITYMGILRMLYYAVYIFFTPHQCLPL